MTSHAPFFVCTCKTCRIGRSFVQAAVGHGAKRAVHLRSARRDNLGYLQLHSIDVQGSNYTVSANEGISILLTNGLSVEGQDNRYSIPTTLQAAPAMAGGFSAYAAGPLGAPVVNLSGGELKRTSPLRADGPLATRAPARSTWTAPSS